MNDTRYRLEYQHGGWAVVNANGDEVAAFGGGPLQLRKAGAFALQYNAVVRADGEPEPDLDS